MSLKAYRRGIEEIARKINSMTDGELEAYLINMGFRVVPRHFITYLRESL